MKIHTVLATVVCNIMSKWELNWKYRWAVFEFNLSHACTQIMITILTWHYTYLESKNSIKWSGIPSILNCLELLSMIHRVYAIHSIHSSCISKQFRTKTFEKNKNKFLKTNGNFGISDIPHSSHKQIERTAHHSTLLWISRFIKAWTSCRVLSETSRASNLWTRAGWGFHACDSNAAVCPPNGKVVENRSDCYSLMSYL